MRVFPVRSLPSLPRCPLYDCLVLLTPPISCSSLILHSLCVPYILGRSFHPLDLSSAPLSHPFAAHSRRIVSGRLDEFVLEGSLRVRMREIDARAWVFVCSTAQRSHVTYRVSRADAAPSVCPFSDLTRRPRAEEVLLSLAPCRVASRRLVNFVNFIGTS